MIIIDLGKISIVSQRNGFWYLANENTLSLTLYTEFQINKNQQNYLSPINLLLCFFFLFFLSLPFSFQYFYQKQPLWQYQMLQSALQMYKVQHVMQDLMVQIKWTHDFVLTITQPLSHGRLKAKTIVKWWWIFLNCVWHVACKLAFTPFIYSHNFLFI